MPAYRLLELTNGIVDGGYFPRVYGHDLVGATWPNGANLTACYVPVPVYDKVVVELDHADVGDTVDVWFALRE